MNTKSRLRTGSASVIGARHRRAGRNGQDAAASWTRDGVAVVVVCDGCSSGASSEVGARLGARLFAQRLGTRLAEGACVRERAVWEGVRGEVAQTFAVALGGSPIDAEAVHEHLLFTIVAAAITDEGAAVWALGDGAYRFADQTRVLGPFANNEPPYLAYDLLGIAVEATFEVLPEGVERIVVATDGIEDLGGDLARFAAALTHPDALRRTLVQLARADERIDWLERRVVRIPALLQDDLAIAVIERAS
jgi:serine/threonine protein phosphatase PrpC